MITINKK